MLFEDLIKARREADTIVVRFLRRYTNLRSLAQLIEDGVHLKKESEIREYCAKRKISLR